MDILKDKSGKFSSKRVWGSLCMAVGLTMAAGSGFNAFYHADSTAYITVLSIGTGLLFGGLFEKGLAIPAA